MGDDFLLCIARTIQTQHFRLSTVNSLGSKTKHAVIGDSYWKELGLVTSHLLWRKCWEKKPTFHARFFHICNVKKFTMLYFLQQC
jgi:hypothetical protein